ncbi:hypothetical protein [Thioalkalivibrio sp. ALR17-21]|uniref:hypothetical protein n=1 Tax=Thioalkalivibrio sp. ALR17-21 TaxID=1269813 RepID=UPI00041EF289|nr:hypothetical protein [Thioalkalivibrio sp. ALR17-21]
MSLFHRKPLQAGGSTGIVRSLTAGLAAVTLMAAAASATADEYRPFVLAWTDGGAGVSEVADEARERLEGADFEILGEYDVTDSARVLVATSDDLLEAAASHDRAAYIAPMRVGITEVDGEVQVSYTHPVYFQHAYRVEVPLDGVAASLEEALGAEETFGHEDGKSQRDLNRYRYAFGMERFDAPYELGSRGSRAEALEALGAGLEERAGGVSEVYRVDIPGRDATLVGVAIRAVDGAEEDASDRNALETVDVNARRHTAYVPYEVLVNGGDVEALHMRFRMALHFPDLSMLGSNSFIQLRNAPGAVEEALQEAAGFASSGFQWDD